MWYVWGRETMKIECTKREWNFILNNICSYHNQTNYKYPKATCIVYDDNEIPLVNIDINFMEENEKMKNDKRD